MAKVYLETSFFSACVTDRTDVGSVHWKQRSLAWLKTQAPRHEVYISDEVIGELSDPTYRAKDQALAYTTGLPRLDIIPDVLLLAELLVNQQVMPRPVRGDATHVAVCAYYGVEYLLSWNVKHLANPNKRIHLAVVCSTVGRAAPTIATPDLLWED